MKVTKYPNCNCKVGWDDPYRISADAPFCPPSGGHFRGGTMQRDGTDPPSQPGSEQVAVEKTSVDFFENQKSVKKFQKGHFHREKKLFSTNGNK